MLLLIAFLISLVNAQQSRWEGDYVPSIIIRRLSTDFPAFGVVDGSIKTSKFKYNYNAAYIPQVTGGITFAMAIRVQDLIPNAKTIYDVGPSSIAVTMTRDEFYQNEQSYQFTYIDDTSVIIGPNQDPRQSLGTEDPRIVLYESKYFMYYSAVSPINGSTDVRCQLSLATCDFNTDLKNASNWILHGPLFPERDWSKSGALLIYNATMKYLFFGDKNITIATTTDMKTYVDTKINLITPRENYFDSELVESGPEPIKLSDGNYLFLYNSARKTSLTSPKPNWNLEYNLGFVVLSGKDPTKVIYRSNDPIMSPELPWERCDDRTTENWRKAGLTPNVIFVEGWKKLGPDKFLVIYQGCDAFTSFFILEVDFKYPVSWQTVLLVLLCSFGMLALTSIIGLIYYYIHGRTTNKHAGYDNMK